MRSAKLPLSPSSALQTMYFCAASAPATVFHLMPVGKARPRARRPCRDLVDGRPGPAAMARAQALQPALRLVFGNGQPDSITPHAQGQPHLPRIQGSSSTGPRPADARRPVRIASASPGDILGRNRAIAVTHPVARPRPGAQSQIMPRVPLRVIRASGKAGPTRRPPHPAPIGLRGGVSGTQILMPRLRHQPLRLARSARPTSRAHLAPRAHRRKAPDKDRLSVSRPSGVVS